MRKTSPWILGLVLAIAARTSAQNQSSGPWVMQDSRTTASLRGIHAVGGGVAWASGTDGTVLRTEDSGYMWQSCAMPPGAEKLDFRGIWAWDADTAIVMSSGPGDQSRVYKTTDGCSHWTLVFTNPDKDGFFDSLLFLDRRNGFILGDPTKGAANYATFTILQTSSSGAQWARVLEPSQSEPGQRLQPMPEEGFFAASNSSMAVEDGRVWIGTSRARVLRREVLSQAVSKGKSTGISLPAAQARSVGVSGTDWQSSSVPLAGGNPASGIFSLAFRNAQHGMAVGGDYQKPSDSTGTAAWTADGGEHWTAAAKPPHGYRSAVAWDAAAKAWIAAGTNGSDISYDDGKTWSPLDSASAGGNWNAISLPWIVGPHGRIAKIDEKRLPR